MRNSKISIKTVRREKREKGLSDVAAENLFLGCEKNYD